MGVKFGQTILRRTEANSEEKVMTVDWAADVKKYVSNPEASAIAGIVRHCGIALQQRDSSLVSFLDKEEVARVRTSFLRKKLELTNPDADLDKAILAVADKMKGDHTKNRVTVYYLLAEHFGKLSVFR
jgi:3-dehydroquinate synthetase